MKKIYWIIIFYIFASCAEEDPKLVNPPPPYQSIRIRLLNAFNSNDVISWGYNGNVYSNSVEYLGLTASSMPPPYDSIKIELYQNNKKVHSPERKIRLVRETRYLIIAGRSLKEGADVDTFMVLATTFGLPRKQGNAHFKFVNLVRDSILKVSIVEGCPNGKVLISNVPYFAYPYLKTVPFGNYTISVVVNNGVNSDLIDIYSVNFLEDNEYTLFFVQKKDGTYSLFLYNDYDSLSTNLVELSPVENKHSFIRVANFASENVTLTKSPATIISDNLESGWVSPYFRLSACTSDFPDTLEISYSSNRTVYVYSFEVLKRYTLLIFDSTHHDKKLLMVPPLNEKVKQSGYAAIRVVNAIDTNFGMTLSVGTRNLSSIKTGFASGEVLAANLKSNKIGSPVLVEPGYLPLTLFSATEPSILLKSFYSAVEANKSYLIVIYKSRDKGIELSLIPEESQDIRISNLARGIFIQFLNGFPYAEFLTCSIPKHFANIKLAYKESFATVLPRDINQIIINETAYSLSLDENKMGLYIVTGSKDEIELFDASISSMGKEMNSYRRRFFNASPEARNIGIFYDSSKTKTIVNELSYGSFSQVEKVFLERKFSLVIFDNISNRIINQFSDIFLSFGKNYTLVFLGTKTKGYSLNVVQEY